MTEEHTEHWYCLRSKAKREHLAAAMLHSRLNLEVFCPRITITKKTIRGPKAFTEALFPGYVFCRFDYYSSSRVVTYSQGITGIVKFGQSPAVIPEAVISHLKSVLPQETTEIAPPSIQEGKLVEIIEGCFAGETGKVTQIVDGTNRVNLLIEFLGNHVHIELPAHTLTTTEPHNPGVSLGLRASVNR